ncbi:hypothetical protein ACVII1_006267 [Bradyrhizobium elkanii]|uniref:hypothetical protein n=1 Tax=Bradyrhizobium TaxID=374 RepID=UPI002711EB6F|nr:hypothetical protein [Bradyrhizobium elkanii]WLA40197.1 hypothetical protein QNJ95_01035 [Bradyrhizobium elkanii]
MNLQTSHALLVDGQVKASITKALDVSGSVSLQNVVQQGSHIMGDIVAKLDLGFSTVEDDIPFDVDTTLGNPIVLSLATISLPIIGDVEVDGEFSFDIPSRQVCVALTLAGLVTLAKTCVNF